MSCDENPALLLYLGINLKKHTLIKKRRLRFRYNKCLFRSE